MSDKILDKSSRYDILVKFLPGFALLSLVVRFTKFCNIEVDESIVSKVSEIILSVPISYVVGICIDALGSLLGKLLTLNMDRAGYNEYRETVACKKKGINIYMLETRRVLYRNVAVMFLLFLCVKLYEMYLENTYCNAVLIIISFAIFVCGWKSRHIDEYKQKRIEIWRKEREEANPEKQKN